MSYVGHSKPKTEKRKAKTEIQTDGHQNFFFWIVLWEVQNVETSDKKWGSKNFDFVVNLNIGRTSFEPKKIASELEGLKSSNL
jgi:hypothetical protein